MQISSTPASLDRPLSPIFALANPHLWPPLHTQSLARGSTLAPLGLTTPLSPIWPTLESHPKSQPSPPQMVQAPPLKPPTAQRSDLPPSASTLPWTHHSHSLTIKQTPIQHWTRERVLKWHRFGEKDLWVWLLTRPSTDPTQMLKFSFLFFSDFCIWFWVFFLIVLFFGQLF